jgi:zinc ribbon protein
MSPARSARDHEGLQRVLLLGGVLVGLAGVGIGAWGLVADSWGLVGGPVLVVFGVTCLVVSRDDGRGRFCPECVARNPEDAEVCDNCGHALG